MNVTVQMKDMIREQLDTTVNKINIDITEELEKMQKVGDDVQEMVKKVSEEKTGDEWSKMLKSNIEEIKTATKTAISDENSKLVKSAMASSKKAIDSNFMERESRKKNVVIVNVPESGKTTLAEQRTDDKDTVIELLQLAEEEIKGVYRPGPPLGEGRNKDRTKPRPIIVQLSTPQLAESLHDHGYGKRLLYEFKDGDDVIEIPVFVNKDLILADRVANYEARVARNKRNELRGEKSSENFPDQTESRY